MSTKVTRWTISDELWEGMELLLPKSVNMPPCGDRRKRVCYRKVMNGILFVLRTRDSRSWNRLVSFASSGNKFAQIRRTAGPGLEVVGHG